MTDASSYGGEPMTDYEETLNWDNVGVPVPLGDYDCVVTAAKYQPDKNNKHMLKVQLEIEAAYNPENVESSIGRFLFDNWPFTQQGGFRPKQFATAASIGLPAVVSKTILEEWAGGIVGLKVGVTVVHRDWQGQTMANISKFKPYQGSGITAPAEQEAPAQHVQPTQQAKAPAQQPQQAKPMTVREAMAKNGTQPQAKR